ncbi:MAG: Tat pathway signal protein [Lysobacteraceae bacterium]|nr:MAG: Tat pathway signal protein [Xanthomonadaceae bacterium]
MRRKHCTISAARRRFLTGLGGCLSAASLGSLMPQLALLPRTAMAQSASDYRALVCVYLAGANDSFNLLVPRDSESPGSLYDSYRTARGGVFSASNPAGLALPFSELLPVRPEGSETDYGLHPSLADFSASNGGASQNHAGLHSLFQQQRLAFVCNMGPLLEPISKRDYENGAPRPPQLFSHNDQERLWHIGGGTRNDPHARFGWGGQLAKTLTGGPLANGLSPTLSVAGAAHFLIGDQLLPYQLSAEGVNLIDQYASGGAANAEGARRAVLDELLADSHDSPFMQGYADTVRRALSVGESLAGLLDGPEGQLSTVFPSGNTLADQLAIVARMIRISRDQLGARRQVYYVRFGSFDLHSGMFDTGGSLTESGHGALLTTVNQALGAFWSALGEIGAQEQVTTFTMSEFARTLSGNGNGSDHAWGGNQFVFGGAVRGGRLYGRYPRLQLDADDDTAMEWSFARGQYIPTTSVDQYGATLARWMGVTDTAALDALFPGLARFPSRDLGFMA